MDTGIGSLRTIKMYRVNLNWHIEKEICICYHANRQKAITFQCEQRNESPNRVAAQSGDSSFLVTAAKHPPGYLSSLWSPWQYSIFF